MFSYKSAAFLLGVGAFIAWSIYRRGLSAINPVSENNVVYSGLNAAGAALTGQEGWTVGSAIYDALTPRGIRNNNPGNIVFSPANNWQGQTGTDGKYATFSDPHWGLRALARLLTNYMRAGYDTPAKIISRWAPAIENDTGSYVAAVSKAIGVAPSAKVTAASMPALIAAIVRHENGQQPYSDLQIANAIRAALA